MAPIGSNITIAKANEFINSYLANYYGTGTGKFPAKAFLFSASALKTFINANPDVENMKFMLAQDTGTSLLTMVLVGVDSSGNYVTSGGMVMDNCNVCPPNCPSGTAGNDNI